MKKIVQMILIVLITTNCAFMKKENRVITNALDEIIDPQSTPAKIALAPIGIPLGTVSLLTDTFIVQPIVSIPESVSKTYEIIWKEPEGGIVRQSFLLVPKIVFTPIGFLILWYGYTFFE